jgi:uncharacterized protein (TIGR03437 family)
MAARILGIFGFVLFASSVLAQSAAPRYGTAERTAYVNLTYLAREEFARASEPPRTVREPLNPSLLDVPRRKPFVASGLTPELERLLAPRAGETQAEISPSTPRTLSGFQALSDAGFAIPSDTQGAVGPNHLVTALNTEVLVQNRQGRSLTRVTLDSFFSRLGPFTSGTFDPRVFYDVLNQRWILCAAADAQLNSSALLLAVTTTPDPTGNWQLYKLNAEPGNGLWIDYPTVGHAGPWVAISFNLFQGDSFRGGRVYVFTKQDLQEGRGNYRAFEENLGTTVPVLNQDAGVDRMVFVGTSFSNANGSGFVRIAELSGTPGAETYSQGVADLAVGTPWARVGVPEDFAPQLGLSALVNTGDDRMQSCVARNGSIWCAHTIFLPAAFPRRSAVQWMQLSGAATYEVRSAGRIDDPNNLVFYAYPSIAVNRNNDVLIGFNRFSTLQHVSANFAFRAGTDPAGQFQLEEAYKPGEAPYQRGTRRNRWGDYSAAQVDPVDDLSLWTVQSYAAAQTANGTSRFGTWWAQVTPLAEGQTCSFTVSPTTVNVPQAGGSFSFTVTAPTGCRWMAVNSAAWAPISGGNPGNGAGTVQVSATANTTPNPRTGTLVIAGQTVTLTQPGSQVPPAFSISSFTAPATAAVGQTFNVVSRFTNTGGSRAPAFRVGFYFSPQLPVTAQSNFSGFGCEFPEGLVNGATSTCSGQISAPRSLAPGTYYIAVIVDDKEQVPVADRTTTIRTSDNGPIRLTAAIDGPVFTAEGVAHGATATSGAVSPGQIVVIYGQRLGPANLVTLQLTGTGLVSTTLGGTRVFFDGVAAPMIYSSAGQISCVVPFGVSGRASTQVQVTYSGVASDTIALPVANVRPGLFSTDFTGRGQAAALNQNNTVNSATLPAAPGSVIQLFGTGFGLPTGTLIDGSVTARPGSLLEAVTATAGGVPASIQYAGPAPGLVAGVVQINVVIPANVTVGNTIPIQLVVGGVAAPAGTTIAVRR